MEQKELRETQHGRTGSVASEKSSQRYNPMKGTRASGSPSSVAGGVVGNGNGRSTRKRAGTTNSLRERKEEIKALKEEDHDSDDDDLDFAPSAPKSDK